MSILDGLPKSAAEYEAAGAVAEPMIKAALEKLNLSERAKSAIDLVKQGLSLANVLGITEKERDALFLLACRTFQFGEIAKARDILINLHVLEPLDARVLYVLASTYQAEGNVNAAGKLYVHFLALDATNTDGFLRLGECFLANKEFQQAIDTFKIALGQAEQTGNAKSVAYAKQMIELSESQRKGAAS